MRFEIDQRIDRPPGMVAETLADPSFYASLVGMTKIAPPEVVHHHRDGDVVELWLRHRFTGHLSGAVRAVIDPARLTWVERATHDLAAREVVFRLHPDHYADRLQCAGTYGYEPDGPGTRRRCRGELKVRAPLGTGALVERAIVSGLREHWNDEARAVEEWGSGPNDP